MLTADLEPDVDIAYLEMHLSHLRVQKHSAYLLCQVRQVGMLTCSNMHKSAHTCSALSASNLPVVVLWYEHVPYIQPIVTALEQSWISILQCIMHVK
jgi:hypothetical protein